MSVERRWEVSRQRCRAWTNRLATFQPAVPSSRQHRAALFAFIKLRRKSHVSPFRGWSSASFTDIRVCLCGWVMDLLCWYVLLWWLQRPIQSLGSFHWTVTQQLLCFTKTFRRWLFTQQTPPNCKPANPCGPPGIRAESNKEALEPNMRVFTGGSGICISHSCSECVFFFFFWIILLRIHIFLSPREVQDRGSREGEGGFSSRCGF